MNKNFLVTLIVIKEEAVVFATFIARAYLNTKNYGHKASFDVDRS